MHSVRETLALHAEHKTYISHRLNSTHTITNEKALRASLGKNKMGHLCEVTCSNVEVNPQRVPHKDTAWICVDATTTKSSERTRRKSI